MRDPVEVDDDEFQRNSRKFATLSGKGIAEVVEDQARGYLRRVIAMTPPQGGGKKGMAARRAQEGRILADLHGIFAPVKLKKERPEAHPELVSLLLGQQMRRRKTAWRRRQRNPKYYVDERKFKRLYMDLKRKVGRLAGGWNASGEALNVKRSAWIRRHGTGEGSANVDLRPESPSIELENNPHFEDISHLLRISDHALMQQRNALGRQLPFLMRRYLRGAKLTG